MVKEINKQFYYNNSGTDDIILTLEKEVACSSNGIDWDIVEGFEQRVAAGSEDLIKFDRDGYYKIYETNVTTGVKQEASPSPVQYRWNLFSSMVVYTEAALCRDADECLTMGACAMHEPEEDYTANALSKIILYIAEMTPKYDTILADVLPNIKCSAIGPYKTLESSEKLYGVSDIESINQIELAYLYDALYKADANMMGDRDEIYKHQKLSYCIAKLGLDTDCEPYVPPGEKHTATITVEPTIIGLGNPTDVTVSYRFDAKGDEFLAVIDTNIPNVNISKLDGNTYHEIIQDEVDSKNYYITYTYKRGGVQEQNTVTASTRAYPPQWYGGESTRDDFSSGGVANFTEIEASLINTTAVYKSTSNGTSSNTGTEDKYIWWITANPVRFFIGSFEILTGPWSSSCDPNSYAIIHKTVNTVMKDGTTTKVLHYYRTCSLQSLQDQTLTYELKE